MNALRPLFMAASTALLASFTLLGGCPLASTECRIDPDCGQNEVCRNSECIPRVDAETDAGPGPVPADAGQAEDAGPAEEDAGPDAVDAGTDVDAGDDVDAGTDAGSTDDADAGSDDAGDAG